VKVALRVHDVDDGKPKEDPQMKRKHTLVKALQFEINCYNQAVSETNSNSSSCLSKAVVFPLDQNAAGKGL